MLGHLASRNPRSHRSALSTARVEATERKKHIGEHCGYVLNLKSIEVFTKASVPRTLLPSVHDSNYWRIAFQGRTSARSQGQTYGARLFACMKCQQFPSEFVELASVEPDNFQNRARV